MKVWLSRTRDWGRFNSRDEVMTLLQQKKKDIEFVRSGKSQFVVIPDDVSEASQTALLSGGTVMQLSNFFTYLNRIATNKKSTSRTRKSSTSSSHSRKKSSRKKKTESPAPPPPRRMVNHVLLFGDERDDWAPYQNKTDAQQELGKIFGDRSEFVTISADHIDHIITANNVRKNNTQLREVHLKHDPNSTTLDKLTHFIKNYL